MRAFGRIAIAGIAALGIAGVVAAAERDVHVLEIALPDGSVEEVRYSGDVAPRIVTAAVAADADDDPFAEMDRTFAAIDAEADRMLAQVAQAAPAAAGGAAAPDGVVHRSYVRTAGGRSGGCVQSYQVTSYGGGEKPKVVTQSSGDCTGVRPLVPESTAARPAPEPATRGHMVTITRDAHVI